MGEIQYLLEEYLQAVSTMGRNVCISAGGNEGVLVAQDTLGRNLKPCQSSPANTTDSGGTVTLSFFCV